MNARRPARHAGGWRRRLFGALLVVMGGAAAPLAAQSTAERFELTRPVEAGLVRLQEQWLQWLSAINQSDQERAESAVADLLATCEQLGMQRLPDLAIGAAARAVQAARAGDETRAAWAIAAAERLDPGRPETAFAAATVHRLAGSYPQAVGQHVRGWWRLASELPWARWVRIHIGYWLLATFLLATTWFVSLALVAHRRALAADARRLLGALPPPVMLAVAVVFLLWPLALPGRWLWLLTWWAGLAWIYEGLSGRIALACGLLVLAAAPSLVQPAEATVALELSPAMRATRNLATYRLHGSLFADLEVLGTTLAGQPATNHLYGDLHRRLGQWEQARGFYQSTLDAEPDNVSALLAMGAYHFRRNDFGNAVQAYQRAVTAAPNDPAGFYNLSLAYSQNNYQFEESNQALQQAQAIDKALVSRWIQEASDDRVVVRDGGFARQPEIAAQLLAGQKQGQVQAAASRRWLGFAVPVCVGLVASVLAAGRRRVSPKEAERAGVASLPRWLEDFVPGGAALVRGAGLSAFCGLWWLAGCVLLPLVAGRAVRTSLGYEPGNLLWWLLGMLGLGLAVGLRAWLTRRAEG
jgi:tetratricopeptide (TPR) repeat protein